VIQIKRKIAIVTGSGRLKGIGAAICLKLAEAGFDIFFTYWNPYDRKMFNKNEDDAQLLLDAIEERDVRAHSLELDLTDPGAADVLLNAVEEKLGMPLVLVNNAAHSTESSYTTLTAEVLDEHYLVNIRATAFLSATFARRFKGKKGGRIINLTSGQSLGPMPGELAYAITKGGVEALTTTLAAEVGEKGITVNAVNPGPTDTGWMTPENHESLAARFPAGRVGEPQDVARLVNFLASEEAEWVTGQIIHSEGGFKRG
jgi:3-oxoacyl-[acyl-carrier protein] reductase